MDGVSDAYLATGNFSSGTQFQLIISGSYMTSGY